MGLNLEVRKSEVEYSEFSS